MKAKRIMAAVAALTMCAAVPMTSMAPMMTGTVLTASAAGSGTINGVTWTLDDNDNLTITSTDGDTIVDGTFRDMTVNNITIGQGITRLACRGYDGTFDKSYRLTIDGEVNASNVNTLEKYSFYNQPNVKMLRLDNVTFIGFYALYLVGSNVAGGANVYINTPADEVDIKSDAFNNAVINLYVPEGNSDGWRTKLAANNSFGAKTINVISVKDDGGIVSPFLTEFQLKHEVTAEGGSLPDLTSKEFKYAVEAITMGAPAIAGGTFAENNDGEYVSDITLPTGITAPGEYWYKVTESSEEFAGYTKDANVYYLHIIVSNLGGDLDVGITQVQLHKTYQQTVAPLGTNLAFAVPNGYYNSYGEDGNAFEWKEENTDEAAHQIAYFSKSDNDMDMDVYQWKKGDGETLMSAAEDELTDYEEPKPTIISTEVNGLDAVYYEAVEEYDEEEFKTFTYLIDDNKGNIVELVFWMDLDKVAEQTETKDAILNSLTARDDSDKTDTLTGVFSAGSLKINVANGGSGAMDTDTFEMKVTLTPPTGTTGTVTYTINEGTTKTANWAATGSTTVTIEDLNAGDVIEFTNLPYGTTYKVEETEKGGLYQNPKFSFVDPDTDEDDKLLDKTFSGNEWKDCYATGSISDDEDELNITNRADVPIDVGTFLESKPFMAIFGGASVLAACAFITRKKRTEDAE